MDELNFKLKSVAIIGNLKDIKKIIEESESVLNDSVLNINGAWCSVCSRGHLDAVKYLVKNNKVNLQQGLINAIKYKQMHVVEYLKSVINNL